jgi:hypothetical protein
MGKLGLALVVLAIFGLSVVDAGAAGFGVPGGAASMVAPSAPSFGGAGFQGAHPRTLLAPAPVMPSFVVRPPPRVIIPTAFVPHRFFHQRFGHVVAFVNPTTLVIWPSGFWCWHRAQWWWVPQTLAWPED